MSLKLTHMPKVEYQSFQWQRCDLNLHRCCYSHTGWEHMRDRRDGMNLGNTLCYTWIESWPHLFSGRIPTSYCKYPCEEKLASSNSTPTWIRCTVNFMWNIIYHPLLVLIIIPTCKLEPQNVYKTYVHCRRSLHMAKNSHRLLHLSRSHNTVDCSGKGWPHHTMLHHTERWCSQVDRGM